MTQPGRNHAFDNLRTAMVLFIVLLHAACAYATGIPWWHAQDAKSQVFDVLIVLIDGFALPVLFFVAGLFARPTLDKYGTAGFLGNKLKRLGIPLLLLPAFYLPTMVYSGYVHRAADPLPFLAYWANWMASLSDWGFVVITNMEQGAAYADAFTPHHLWFVSLLLVFFVGYALVKRVVPACPRLGMGWLTGLTAAGILITYAALNALMQDWAWARFGPFLLFQPTRIPVYLGMFLFGALARPHMERLRPFPGPWWMWLILFLASEGIMLALVPIMMAPGPQPPAFALVHGLLRAAMAVSAAGFFVNLFVIRLGSPSPWRESLAASSYDLYLWHMPAVVFAQALLLATPLPLAAKPLIAFFAPVLLLWSLSRGANRIRPWQWAGCMGAIFLAFCLGAA